MTSSACECGTRPIDCFRPTTPLQAAGIRVEPPPSVAMPIGASPVATATAAPPLDPPLVRSGCHALRVRPNKGASVRHFAPNSDVVVLPMRMAPCCRRRAMAAASSVGTLSANSSEPKVVFTPLVLTRSLQA